MGLNARFALDHSPYSVGKLIALLELSVRIYVSRALV